MDSVAISWAAPGSLRLACGLSAALTRWPVVFSSSSKHYPLYSLNVASMWLKLGRLYMGLEKKAAGERALKKVRVGCKAGLPSALQGTWVTESHGE